MKLRPELVPEPLWELSAYRILGRSDWRRIRTDVLADMRGECVACTAAHPKGMVCHEVWYYDDAQSEATMTALTILCPACNFVHHMGRANLLGRADEAIQHMASVNRASITSIKKLVAEAFEEWERRSVQTWTLRVDNPLLSRWPGLSVLNGLLGRPGAGGDRVAWRDGRPS